ncbi:MAG: DinB family protein, partial [Aigarchaeota archaeon]|nr:DinB family protein [Aigarchaeota archaeon]
DWKPPKWPDEFWPQPGKEVSDEDWNRTVNGFFRDLNRAIRLAEDTKVDLLTFVPETENTYLREVMLIIEHNAYHLGKILDIRKALGDWKR